VLIRKDGTEQPIDDSAAPIRDAHGRVVGCVLVFRDITERRRVEQLAADRLATARLLASVVESSDDAIISKSAQGIIQSWNRAAEWLFGHSAEAAVGQHISLIIPPERVDEENLIMEKLRSGKRVDHFRTVRKRSDGQLVDVSLTISPIFDDAGRFVGASKIARNIAEQKEAEKRIHALMTALTEADQRKNLFLATLAHELRGPLAPIRNSLEIMKGAGGNVRLLEESRSVVDRQISQMERLIDDLFDISRITRNTLELRKQRVELSSVLYQAVEVCRSLAEAAKVQILVTVPSEPIYLNGDPARLSQVFSNLLNNSCKFTEPGGCIWLTAKREASEAVVSVKDTGIGIPPDMLTSIFETFTQVDPALQRAQGGLGIGLSLVKQLVEMHDGTVQAFSDGPGLGCEVVVRLPILAEKPESSQPPAPSLGKQPTGCRILVVDDNKDSADSLSMLLRMSGHQTHVAYDGEEAVEAAEQARPEVVLLDIGLPKLNGLDVCRRIREQPWGKSMVLVALTGWGQVEDRRKSQDAGFDAHLVKPVNYTELTNLLASLQGRQPTS
jgi:PAS domain S-box-containing protein